MSKRRTRVLQATYLTAAFLVVLGFALQCHAEARQYRRLLSNSYTHAFTELTAASEELTAALQKTAYTTPGPLRDSLYQQVYAKALAAQYALGEIPMGNLELEQTAAFFAKTGDYVMALYRDGGDGTETLPKLTQAAQTVTTALRDAQSGLEGGGLDLMGVTGAARQAAREAETQGAAANGAFQRIEADFPEIPTLIYDGPFSEHIGTQAPKLLEGQGQVTQVQAKEAAARFLDRDPGAFTLVSSGGGSLPTFAFSVPLDGGGGYVEVTCRGGQILRFFQDRAVADPTLSPEEGVTVARDYLQRFGFSQMESSYYLERDGALTVHFAPVMDGVFCYPDLVKVTVALDNGALLGYEAHGYLGWHCDRSFQPPAVTQEAALGAVPDILTVLSGRLALIPTAGGTGEALTYEFKCQTAEGAHVLVYVNTQTGQQQNILLLLEDETGTLTL